MPSIQQLMRSMELYEGLMPSSAASVTREFKWNRRIWKRAICNLIKDPLIGCLGEVNTVPVDPNRWILARLGKNELCPVHYCLVPTPRKPAVVVFPSIATADSEWILKSCTNELSTWLDKSQMTASFSTHLVSLPGLWEHTWLSRYQHMWLQQEGAPPSAATRLCVVSHWNAAKPRWKGSNNHIYQPPV